MARVITLEDGTTVSTGQARLPHWTALYDPRVAADIVERDYPGSVDVRGSAMGRSNAPDMSFMGLFRDNVGNTLMLLTESTQTYKLIEQQNLWGPSATMFRMQRPYGEGWGFRAVEILSERDPKNAGILYNRYTHNLPTRTQHELTYSNWLDLFEQIELKQIRFPGVVVCVLTGEPTTLLESIGRIVLALGIGVARALAASFGMTAEIVDALAPLLLDLVDGKPLTIASIANVSSLISPPSIRPFIADASSLYTSVQRGDYATAARLLGVRDVALVQDIEAAAANVISYSSKSVGLTTKVTQAFFNIGTINSFRNQLRSGTVIDRLIDEGSITRVPVMQNVMTAIQSGAFVGTLPNISELVATAINETSETYTGAALRGMLELGMGQRPQSTDLYDLSLQSLVQQAVNTARTGASVFFMPASLPAWQREVMGREVAKQSGIRVASQTLERTEFY